MEPKYIMIFAIVCLIITHTPLDRFASNFDWGILEKYGYLIYTTDQTKLIIIWTLDVINFIVSVAQILN